MVSILGKKTTGGSCRGPERGKERKDEHKKKNPMCGGGKRKKRRHLERLSVSIFAHEGGKGKKRWVGGSSRKREKRENELLFGKEKAAGRAELEGGGKRMGDSSTKK